MRRIGSDQLSKLNFEPWAPEPDNNLIPSPELLKDIGKSARLAHAMLLRSRDELVAMHEKLECAEIDVMISLLDDARKKAGALAAMIDEAYSRVLIVDERASGTRRTIQDRRKAASPSGPWAAPYCRASWGRAAVGAD
jgi:hypothetical protein